MLIYNDPLLLTILIIFVIILLMLPMCSKEQNAKPNVTEEGIKGSKPITFTDILKYMFIGISLGILTYLVYRSCKLTKNTKINDEEQNMIIFDGQNTIYNSNLDGTPKIYDLLTFQNDGILDKIKLTTFVKTDNINKVFAYLKIKDNENPFVQILILNNGEISFEYIDIDQGFKTDDILTLVMIGTDNIGVEFTDLKIKCKVK